MPKGRNLYATEKPTNGRRIIKGQYGRGEKISYSNAMNELKEQDMRGCNSSKRYLKEKLLVNDELTITLQHYNNTVVFQKKISKNDFKKEMEQKQTEN